MVGHGIKVIVTGRGQSRIVGAAVRILELVEVLPFVRAGILRVRYHIKVGIPPVVYGHGRCIGAAVPVQVRVMRLGLVEARIPPVVYAVHVSVGKHVSGCIDIGDRVGAAVRIHVHVVGLLLHHARVQHVRYAVHVGVLKHYVVVGAAVLVQYAVVRLGPGGAEVHAVYDAVHVGVGRGVTAGYRVRAAVLVHIPVVGLLNGGTRVQVILYAIAVGIIPRHEVCGAAVYYAAVLRVIILLQIGAEILRVRDAVMIRVRNCRNGGYRPHNHYDGEQYRRSTPCHSIVVEHTHHINHSGQPSSSASPS